MFLSTTDTVSTAMDMSDIRGDKYNFTPPPSLNNEKVFENTGVNIVC